MIGLSLASIINCANVSIYLSVKYIINFYNKLGDKRILIHKRDKLKSIQKRFFKCVIKHINQDMTFEDFYNEINDENIDVKYIVLKENELRYN